MVEPRELGSWAGWGGKERVGVPIGDGGGDLCLVVTIL